jgi:glycerol uptake facilitator protein
MNHPILGEFIGTFILILFGTGVGCSINLKKTLATAVGANWVLVAFGWGVAVMLGVYSSGYFASPGHLNPAVTISFAIGGLLDWQQVAPFILAQLAGAFAGALIAALHFWPHFVATGKEGQNQVGVFATGPAIPHSFFNMISEMIATFAFIFTLLLLPGADFPAGFQPLVLAFLLVGISFSFGSTTGYAINPARDFIPRLVYTILPIPNKADSNWSYAWVPIVGPILGATLAVLLFKCLG